MRSTYRLAHHRPHLLRRNPAWITQIDLMVIPVGHEVVLRQELAVEPPCDCRGFLAVVADVHDLHAPAFVKAFQSQTAEDITQPM